MSKCPQCVATNLTSYVIFAQPIMDIDANTKYYNLQGVFTIDKTHTVLIYICSQNHCGITLKTADPI